MRVVRFPYQEGATAIDAPGEIVVELPAGPINHHWTKNVIASPDGRRLYATVGSNSNVAENGIAAEEGRAAIWEIDRATGAHRIFASGLRNPNGLAWEPHSGALWTTVNERDELGSDLVPDYMTSVRRRRVLWLALQLLRRSTSTSGSSRSAPIWSAEALVPDYALGPHTASLGLTFADGRAAARALRQRRLRRPARLLEPRALERLQGDLRPVRRAGPARRSCPVDVLTGFVDADGNALGRPVGVAIDAQGALLVADDVGNRIWRVSAADRAAGQSAAKQ